MRLSSTQLVDPTQMNARFRLTVREAVSLQKHCLLASDFDQTLSFNDSGMILSELLGLRGFQERVAGMARIHLVQQGGELSYLLLHDPEYRRVRKEHLIQVGKRVPLKRNIMLLTEILASEIEGHTFSFYVISAAPEEVVLARTARGRSPACFYQVRSRLGRA